MHRVLFLFLFLLSNSLIAQDSLFVAEDNRYREDQFYASITYNIILNTPRGVSQSDFSTGFHLGFIRDMPINKRRNLAIGVGMGLSSNSYNQNILITENQQGTNFFVDDNVSFGNVTKNKFTTYLIDVPLELRWRTSTTKDYKFWRIYSGLKFSYLLYNSSRLESELVSSRLSNLDTFNNFQYGATLSFGYGTWNFHAYYALNTIFKNSAQINNESLDIQALKLGVIFYIL